jgi:proteasome lid subunit RPN8/RPN11
MTVQLTSALKEALVAQAEAVAPHECCGLLLGAGHTITAIQPASNVHPTPATHFEIEPATLIAAHRAARAGRPQVLGYYHSHPAGPAEPSLIDRAMATWDGKVWAIVGRGEGGWTVRFWRASEAGFVALPSASTSG